MSIHPQLRKEIVRNLAVNTIMQKTSPDVILQILEKDIVAFYHDGIMDADLEKRFLKDLGFAGYGYMNMIDDSESKTERQRELLAIIAEVQKMLNNEIPIKICSFNCRHNYSTPEKPFDSKFISEENIFATLRKEARLRDAEEKYRMSLAIPKTPKKAVHKAI